MGRDTSQKGNTNIVLACVHEDIVDANLLCLNHVSHSDFDCNAQTISSGKAQFLPAESTETIPSVSGPRNAYLRRSKIKIVRKI